MKAVITLLIPIALGICSCAGNGSHSDNRADSSTATPVAKYDAALPNGKIVDNINCLKQKGNNYALYLPSYYSSRKPFPCIFFFDAHARGVLPITLYKDLAEKYGFVFIGSNVSKNGNQWQATNEVIKVLMDDVRTRVNIDPKRIYTSGFSGGSRVASSVAIFDGGIAGVIGCAAGFPQIDNGIKNKFDYVGMVGEYDFNLTDMKALDKTLDQNGFTHQLLTFTGKHDWPPLADFRTAMLWMQANAMNKRLQPQTDSLVVAIKNDYDQRLQAAAKQADAVKQFELLTGLTMALNETTDITNYKKQLTELTASPALTNALAAQEQVLQNELRHRQELSQQFTTQDEQWWIKKIAELRQKTHNAKAPKEAQMNQRLLNLIGLLGYMNTDHSLKTDDLQHADSYLKIFKLADPQNPDHAYLSAISNMKKSNAPLVLASLNEAAALGYSDVQQLLGEPAFNMLHEDAGFKAVVNKVRANGVAGK